MQAKGFSGLFGSQGICAKPISKDEVDRLSLPNLPNQETPA